MGTVKQAGVFQASGTPVLPASVKSDWIVAHDSLGAAAETTALYNVTGYSNSNVHIIKVPDGAVGFKVRTRYDKTITTVTTSPVVRFYGLTGAEPTAAGVLATDGTAWAERLDNSTQSAAGLPLTLVTTGTGNRIIDGTYAYSEVLPTDGRIDCRGSKYIMALTETASSVSGGSNTTVELMVQFVN